MEKDIRQKKLLDYEDVFVDIHNNITFDGEKVLDEGSLERLPTESFARMADGGLRQGNRDVHKVDKWNNHYRLIYGIENQVKTDNTMVERAMGYDYASYEEQIRQIVEENRKNGRPAYAKRIHDDQKLAPVLTTVLYFGSNWTGPRSLHELLKFPEGMEERLKAMIPDYPLNLIEVKKLPAEVRSRLTSDFRLIAEYVACRNKPKELDRILADNTYVIKHPVEFFDLLSEITSDRRFKQAKEMLTEKERQGGLTMCEGLDRIEKRGEKRGVKKERKRMLQLVQQMAENGEAGLIPQLSQRPSLLQEMYKKYNLL